MSNYFLINADGKAYNEILLDDPAAYPVPDGHSLTLVSEAPANLQWVDEGPVVPPEIPSITRLQFLVAAQKSGLLTPAESLAAAKNGDVPVAIDAVFDTLTAAEANDARVVWATMTKIERNEPLVAAAAAAFGLNDAQVDAFFLAAAAL